MCIISCVNLQSDMFQEDIYPPCPAGVPALTADEWVGGTNKDPVLMKINEGATTVKVGDLFHTF